MSAFIASFPVSPPPVSGYTAPIITSSAEGFGVAVGVAVGVGDGVGLGRLRYQAAPPTTTTAAAAPAT